MKWNSILSILPEGLIMLNSETRKIEQTNNELYSILNIPEGTDIQNLKEIMSQFELDQI